MYLIWRTKSILQMHKQLQVQQLVSNVVRHPPGGKYSYYYPGALYWSQVWYSGSRRFQPLTRYVKLWVAHAPGTFSPPQTSKETLVSHPGMHHAPWCMSGSLTRGGGENVPGIPGACINPNYTHLARGPYTNARISNDLQRLDSMTGNQSNSPGMAAKWLAPFKRCI